MKIFCERFKITSKKTTIMEKPLTRYGHISRMKDNILMKKDTRQRKRKKERPRGTW